mgnify:CR=1 FL=1
MLDEDANKDYALNDEIVNTVMDMLPQQMIEVIEEFSTRYL